MLTPFGKEVRKLRIDQGLTLKAMAEALDLTSAYLSAVETGKKRITESLQESVIRLLAKGSEETANLLKDAANKSNGSVELTFAGRSEQAREVATVFARSFETLPDEDLMAFKAFIEQRTRGRG